MASTSSRRSGALRGTVARHGRLRVPTVTGTLARGITTGIAVVLVSALVFLGIVWWNLQSGVKTFELAEQGEVKPGSGAVFEGGTNILLVGSDSREGQGAEFGEGQDDASGTLNDVNMLLHLSEDHSHASVVSIPRDTLVDTPECVNDHGETQYEQYGVMMNSILDQGGINCVVATVEAASGLDIQYAALVKFKGVIEMSNAVGGVDICVEQPISDSYIGLELDAGMHSLQGAEALKFLRTRHGVGDGSDLARISNQQVFLSALFRKVKSDETFSDPGRMYGIARAATQNMTLSSNLNSVDTLVSIALALSQVPLEKMAFVRLPVVDAGVEGRVMPDPDQAEVMWQMLREDKSLLTQNDPKPAPPQPSPDTPDTPDAPQDEDAMPVDPEGETVPEEGAESTEPTAEGEETPAETPKFDGQTADQATCSNPEAIF